MLVRNIHKATQTNILPPPPKFHPHFNSAPYLPPTTLPFCPLPISNHNSILPFTSLPPHLHSVPYLTCIQASLTFCPLLDLYPSALTLRLLVPSTTHTNILSLIWPPPIGTIFMSLYSTSTFCLFLRPPTLTFCPFPGLHQPTLTFLCCRGYFLLPYNE